MHFPTESKNELLMRLKVRVFSSHSVLPPFIKDSWMEHGPRRSPSQSKSQTVVTSSKDPVSLTLSTSGSK